MKNVNLKSKPHLKLVTNDVSKMLTENVQNQEKDINKLLVELLENHQLNTITREDLENILNNHFERMEVLFDKHTEKIRTKPSEKVGSIYTGLVQGMNQGFLDFKGKFKKKISDSKENIKTTSDIIHEKVSSVKENIKETTSNKAANIKISMRSLLVSKVQSLNNKIKNFTKAIDNRFQVIESVHEENIKSPGVKKIESIGKDIEENQADSTQLSTILSDDIQVMDKESLETTKLKVEEVDNESEVEPSIKNMSVAEMLNEYEDHILGRNQQIDFPLIKQNQEEPKLSMDISTMNLEQRIQLFEKEGEKYSSGHTQEEKNQVSIDEKREMARKQMYLRQRGIER